MLPAFSSMEKSPRNEVDIQSKKHSDLIKAPVEFFNDR